MLIDSQNGSIAIIVGIVLDKMYSIACLCCHMFMFRLRDVDPIRNKFNNIFLQNKKAISNDFEIFS